MIHTELGHASAMIGGIEYPLIPSLENIYKIGNSEEIIQDLVDIDSPVDFEYLDLGGESIPIGMSMARGYATASWVLECCGWPPKLTGWTRTAVVNGKPVTCIVKGKIPVHDVFVWAAFCMKHGVIGVSGDKNEDMPTEQKESVIREFNPMQYIYLATELFHCSVAEASGMTMTQLVLMCKAKNDAEREAKGKPKTRKDALSMRNEMFKWAQDNKVKLGKRIK